MDQNQAQRTINIGSTVGKMFLDNGPKERTIYVSGLPDLSSFKFTITGVKKTYKGLQQVELKVTPKTRYVLFGKPPFKEYEKGITYTMATEDRAAEVVVVNRPDDYDDNLIAMEVYEYLVHGTFPNPNSEKITVN